MGTVLAVPGVLASMQGTVVVVVVVVGAVVAVGWEATVDDEVGAESVASWVAPTPQPANSATAKTSRLVLA
jgi:hypothetical protein